MAARTYIIATMDTKGEEARWVAERIRAAGQAALPHNINNPAFSKAVVNQFRQIAERPTNVAQLSHL